MKTKNAEKTYDAFTPADVATVSAALEQCEHDGDDTAVEIVAYAIEMEGIINDNDETTAEELAYYVVHELGRQS